MRVIDNLDIMKVSNLRNICYYDYFSSLDDLFYSTYFFSFTARIPECLEDSVRSSSYNVHSYDNHLSLAYVFRGPAMERAETGQEKG